MTTGNSTFGDLQTLADSPLTSHGRKWRHDLSATQQILDRTCGTQVIESEVRTPKDIDTIAWAHKFDLLRGHPRPANRTPRFRSSGNTKDLTFALTCMGRLEHLKQTLPRLVTQPRCHVVVTDYSCPDQSGQWIRDNFSNDQVTVIDVAGRKHFNRSEAKNISMAAVGTPWICLIDADVLVADNFSDEIHKRLAPNQVLRSIAKHTAVGGTFIFSRDALQRVDGHDLNFRDWGEEDDDLIDAFLFTGQQLAELPANLIQHIAHDDEHRMRFHSQTRRKTSWLVNRIYRAAKWDIAKVLGAIPSAHERELLYQRVEGQVVREMNVQGISNIAIPLGRQDCKRLAASIGRSLVYRVEDYSERGDVK